MIAYMDWYKNLLAQRYDYGHTAYPMVSVIMPVHDRADILRRALLSVVSQTMPSFELIVVDDGSDDDPADIVSRFGDDRLRFVRLNRNAGAAQARNVGLAEAKAPLIAYLDSDDWWDKDFLSVMVGEAMRSEHQFLYSAQRVIRPASKRGTRRREVIRFAPYNAGLLENANYISQIAVVHTRELADDVGGFDESLRRYVDWEFFLRLAGSVPPLGVPAILSHYDQSNTGSISTNESRTAALHRVWETSLGSPVDLAYLSRAPRRARKLDAGREANNDQGCTGDDLGVAAPWKGYRLSAKRLSKVASDDYEITRKISIIIPSYGVPEYLKVCLASVVEYTPPDVYDLIVVDNGSDRDVMRVLDHFARAGLCSVIRNEMNAGFTRAVRQGLDVADPASDVVILNNDALVTAGWLNELAAVAHRYPSVGIVAPRQVLLPGDATMTLHVPAAMDDFECDTNLSAHHRNVLDPYFDPRYGITELSYAPFFCAYIRREVLTECGYLDPTMGAHYQSDWVYCDAVRNVAKRTILHTPHSKVYHFNGQAGKELRSRDPELFVRLATDRDVGRGLETQSDSAVVPAS